MGKSGGPTHSSTPFPTLSKLTLLFFPHSPNTSLPHPPHSADMSFHTFLHLPSTSSHFLTLPHTPPTSPHTFLHLPPHSSPTITSPDTVPSPLPTLPHTHSPHFLTSPTPPLTLPHTSHILSFTPFQNFSLFSFIPKLDQKLLVNFIKKI